MPFGIGIGDIVLVSGSVFGLYTIQNAAVELLRQLTSQIAADGPLESLKRITSSATPGPLVKRPATEQLCRCFQLLQNLDTIASRYIKNESSLLTPTGGTKKHLTTDFRWGLYKRKEFVALLGEIRNMINLLHMLQQNGNRGPAPPIRPPGAVPYVELTDALDRSWVCSFEHCNTYEVSRGRYD